MWFHEAKELIAAYTVDYDALHIYFAVAIQIAAAIILQRSLARWICWFVVFFCEVINECIDLITSNPDQPATMGATLHDLINSLVLPTVLLVICRYRPRLAVRCRYYQQS